MDGAADTRCANKTGLRYGISTHKKTPTGNESDGGSFLGLFLDQVMPDKNSRNTTKPTKGSKDTSRLEIFGRVFQVRKSLVEDRLIVLNLSL